ncbi:putative galactosylceramide sulfotransferase isoform X2 [Apostichopus japonicus]|uniref:Putative galactosylceramide sulfotransferase isoform X2 n=1 Tax=Stichopus japonicus TaxID=307972 RepID=A0A2G8K0Z7_STIJA|nr:putative galactosylceramide sulfotransferase isoform X2 [Apostichopus japonicus]
MNIWKVLFIFSSVVIIAYVNQQWILPTYCPSILQFLKSSFGYAANQEVVSNLRRPGKILAGNLGDRKTMEGSDRPPTRAKNDSNLDKQLQAYQYDRKADGTGYEVKEVDINVHVKTNLEQLEEEERQSLINVKEILPSATRPDLAQDRIVFMKTHRTSSGTMACILKRYGYNHELLFALPKELRANNFLQTVKFKREFVYQYPGVINQKYNILANNARYNRKEMAFVIPKATFITMLRRPEEQFESVFGYHNMTSKLNLAKSPNPIASFLERADYYYGQEIPYSDFLKNGQLFDFGLNRESMGNNANIVEMIKSLEAEFDLVMIREYFDESLILLKKILDWKLDDILYISTNIRSDINRFEIDQPLREKIAQWNSGDVELYEHFNKTLWWRIEQYGSKFKDDLATFRAKNQEVFERCVDTRKSDASDRRQTKFVARDSSKLCQDLLRSDEEYTSSIRERQKELFRRKQRK